MLCSSSLAVDCRNSTIYQQVLSSKHTLQVDNLNYINPFRSWVSEVAVHYFSVCTMREGGRSRTVFLFLVYSSWLTYFVHLLDTTYGIINALFCSLHNLSAVFAQCYCTKKWHVKEMFNKCWYFNNKCFDIHIVWSYIDEVMCSNR